MATGSATKTLMTVEEFHALPDDGRERWLIRGQLREAEDEVTRRNRKHSKTEARIAQLICNWLDGQPQPRGAVYSGEAGFWLSDQPGSSVGIDVAFASPDVVAAQDESESLVVGAPLLAVEILSPSDKHEEITEKVEEYLAAGVKLVWLVDPDFRTVQVFQPGQEPEMFNIKHTLSGNPHLPGLSLAVATIFE